MISVRKVTSFTVTEVDAFGNTLVSIVYGSGFTYDAAGEPTGGTVNSIVYKHYDVQQLLTYSQSITKLFNVTTADLDAFVPTASGQWYDPSNVSFLAGFDASLIYIQQQTGQYAEINGGSLDDKLIGTSVGDVIFGGDGNDRIYGNGGFELLYGGNGNDVIFGDQSAASNFFGGQGMDIMFGSAGFDSMDSGTENDEMHSGAGIDNVWGGTGNDLIYGDGGNDFLFGEANDDRVQGGAGDDYVDGGNGADRLGGGIDNDILNGGNGNDKVFGHDGNDTISGEGGSDAMTGNAGDDLIKFADGSDNTLGGTGADTFVFALGGAVGTSFVADFVVAEDFLVMGDVGFNTQVAHTAQENFDFFLANSVQVVKGVLFTGSDGNLTMFRNLRIVDLTVANFLTTDGTAFEYL